MADVEGQGTHGDHMRKYVCLKIVNSVIHNFLEFFQLHGVVTNHVGVVT